MPDQSGAERDVIWSGRERGPRRTPSARLLALLALVVLVAAVVAVVAVHAVSGRAGARGPRGAGGPVQVTDVGHRLLGVRAGWELFGLGPGEVVRIQLARARITRTAFPALQSSGPVTLLAGPHQVIVRPLDYVPGYLVPDGQIARPLRGALSSGGVVLPGPRPGEFWMESGDGARMSMLLVGSGGNRLGPELPTPMLSGWPFPDGRGYLMVQRRAGVYDQGPGWRRLVTSGSVAAAGPARWLAVECPRGHCRYLVINPASQSRYLLAGQAPAAQSIAPFAGAVSPDGQFAALVVYGPDGKPVLRLLDLVSCAVLLSVPVNPDTLGNAAWSPDGRWLFAVSPDSRLLAINPVTQAVQGLGVSLPPLSALAVRA
ncbi:MAG TPA: hypothetical protein VGR98_06820 [Streptosporangiaceae bacterium]|nr:hypothetical protein [Streptosporangiaceae bacterium]